MAVQFEKPIALGADHGGYELKEAIKQHLEERGIAYRDFGTNSTASCDYPDYAAATCGAVTNGSSDFAILCCGTGVGMSMCANKIKVSENVEKITIPHFKKVYRFYGRDTGKAIADLITLHDETVDDSQDMEIFDPMATWKKKTVYNFTARELLVPIFLNGRRVYDSPSLPEIQAYCRQQVDTLWDEVKRFDYPHKFVVDLSRKLWDIQQELLRSSQQ